MKKPILNDITYKDERFSLILRPLHEQYIETILGAVKSSLDILRPFMEWAHKEFTVESQRERIGQSREDALKGIRYDFMVFDAETDEFLMMASLHPSSVPNKKCFGIGYWVAKSHCNRGLATLVTKILIAVAFGNLDCDRVEISCNKANKASLRVIEKCGFRYEGEAFNYFVAPDSKMIENGYHPSRTALKFALIKDDMLLLDWFGKVKRSMSCSHVIN